MERRIAREVQKCDEVMFVKEPATDELRAQVFEGQARSLAEPPR
jgi:hypothetical protein